MYYGLVIMDYGTSNWFRLRQAFRDLFQILISNNKKNTTNQTNNNKTKDIHIYIYIYIYLWGSPCGSDKHFSGAAGRDQPNSKIQAAPGTGWHGSRNRLARNESSLRWPAAHLGPKASFSCSSRRCAPSDVWGVRRAIVSHI